MASHAEGVVTRAVRAHLDRDEPLARQALETDEVIDQFEIQIDRIALGLLAQAPGEFELRQVTCGMKIARELERVGDEATTIARRAVELMALPPLATPLDIAEMTFLANAMLKDALDAFVSGNTVLARGVIPRDRRIESWWWMTSRTSSSWSFSISRRRPTRSPWRTPATRPSRWPARACPAC